MINRIIAIEGVDKTGKTTLMDIIKEKFKGNDKIIFLKFPSSDTPIGKDILKKLKNKDFNNISYDDFLEDMSLTMHRYKDLITGAAAYTIVIDRYFISTLVYQGLNKHISNFAAILNAVYNDKSLLLKPDYIVYLKPYTVDDIIKRLNRNIQDEYEKELTVDKLHQTLKNYDIVLNLLEQNGINVIKLTSDGRSFEKNINLLSTLIEN